MSALSQTGHYEEDRLCPALGPLETNTQSCSPLPPAPPQPLPDPHPKLEGGGKDRAWASPSPPGVGFVCGVGAGEGQDGSLARKLGDWGCHPLLGQIVGKELELR